MAEDATIAQEFYKIRAKWDSITDIRWDMAIWVCEFQDLDIIDKFMQIEASPAGIFSDIFFRFASVYTTDERFEEDLWKEFLSWFVQGEDKTYDMIYALKKDGFLPEEYEVNADLPPTFESVVGEFLRLKELLPFDEDYFILYFGPAMHEKGFEKWIETKLKNKLPKDIRLAIIDIETKRAYPKLKNLKEAHVVELTVPLDMGSAMSNAMNKDSDGERPQAISSKFQKQVRVVMDASTKDDVDLQEEVDLMILYGKQLKMIAADATAHLTAAIAFSGKKLYEKALEYATLAVDIAEPELDTSDEAYPIWRAAIMIKGNMYFGFKKIDKGINCYNDLAKTAIRKKDAFYVMEAYRMIAYEEKRRKNLEEAWNASIFALQAGTNLPDEVRIASTFIFVAGTAYEIAQDDMMSDDVLESLEKQYDQYIGKDWPSKLVEAQAVQEKYLARISTFKN